MVKSYFTLFLKFELKRILSYFVLLLLIIFFLESSQVVLESPLQLYLGLFLTIFGYLIIYLWIKAKKIIIIFDTKLNKEQYADEKHIDHLKGRRFKFKYNYWLLKNADNERISRIYKKFFSYTSQHYCLYCYLSTIPIILVWVFSNMYMTPTESNVASLIFIGCIVLLCVAMEKRDSRTYYKDIDSEIKQVQINTIKEV